MLKCTAILLSTIASEFAVVTVSLSFGVIYFTAPVKYYFNFLFSLLLFNFKALICNGI